MSKNPLHLRPSYVKRLLDLLKQPDVVIEEKSDPPFCNVYNIKSEQCEIKIFYGNANDGSNSIHITENSVAVAEAESTKKPPNTDVIEIISAINHILDKQKITR